MVHSRADFFRLTVEELESLDRFARKSAENLHGRIARARVGGRWRACSTASACRRSASRPRSTSRRGWPSGSARTPTRRPTATSSRTRGSPRSRRSCAGSGPRSPRPSPRSPGSGRPSPRRSVAGSPTTRPGTCCASWSRSGSSRSVRSSDRPGEGSAGPLDGKTLVVTGTLEGFTRQEAEEAIRAAGGKVGGLGLEEDRLPRRRRERRLEAGQGPGARRPGPRRGGFRRLLAGEDA